MIPGTTAGFLAWISLNVHEPSVVASIGNMMYLLITGLVLSIAVNTIATMMIGYESKSLYVVQLVMGEAHESSGSP